MKKRNNFLGFERYFGLLLVQITRCLCLSLRGVCHLNLVYSTYYLQKLSHNIFGIDNHSTKKSNIDIFDERLGSKNTDERLGSKNTDERLGPKNTDERLGPKNTDHTARSQEHRRTARSQEHRRTARSQEHRRTARSQEHRRTARFQEHRRTARFQEHRQTARFQEHRSHDIVSPSLSVNFSILD